MREMKPTEFRAALGAFGLSQESAAAHLGVTLRTVGGWANGHYPIPRAVARLLRLMLSLQLDFDHIP